MGEPASYSAPTTLPEGYSRYIHYLRHADKLDSLTPVVASSFTERFAGRSDTIRAVDVGTGSGRIIAGLLDATRVAGVGVEVTAIERSPEAAHELRMKFASEPRVTVIEGEFPLRKVITEEQADFLLASHVMYYFRNMEEFVRSCFDAVRPGGCAVFVAASQSILDNPIYQLVLPTFLRLNTKRTVDTDGGFSFAEDLVPALLSLGVVPVTQTLASTISFSPGNLQEARDFLNNDRGSESDLIRTFSFLWRYPEEFLASQPLPWLRFLEPLVASGQGLRLNYEDKILTCPVLL